MRKRQEKEKTLALFILKEFQSSRRPSLRETVCRLALQRGIPNRQIKRSRSAEKSGRGGVPNCPLNEKPSLEKFKRALV